MANQVVNGTDLLLSMNGAVVAHAKSHTISVSTDMRDTTSKSSAGWKEQAKGRFSWNAKVDGLVSYEAGLCNYSSLMTAMLAGVEVTITSIDNTGGTIVGGLVTPLAGAAKYTGNAIITNVELSAGDGENVTFSVSFEGTGALVPTGAVAVTVGAAKIAATSATLVGLVASAGASCAISFDYGLTAACGTVGVANPATTLSLVPIAIACDATALTTATTYFFRIKTIEGTVTKYGSLMTFRTA